VASLPDLYAGKLCAALDRQHPRDLFDVKFLFDNEGLTEDLRKTFHSAVLYLTGEKYSARNKPKTLRLLAELPNLLCGAHLSLLVESGDQWAFVYLVC
jgi:hypothetical protein